MTLSSLPILYHDDALIAVHKPAGLLVHRTELDRERDVALQRVRDQIGRRVYPVHRLDRATSGVLVFALRPEVASALAADFRGRTLAKHYLAVVRGWTPESGVIERPLAKHKGGEKRAARSRYVRLATVELPIPVDKWPAARYSLVLIALDTGRRHQIRRHMDGISHPLIGDTTHGSGPHNRLFREHLDCHRMLLHAWRFGLRHPVSGEAMTIAAPPPADFHRVCERLGWDRHSVDLDGALTRLPGGSTQGRSANDG
ncbi:pseudouridine synthase [Arhodomonas sp. AD133]|uniref:pseudouridine synthase n=1 Tax=Arhodomonas sp. AD133 TaxID=3415009 RepID=UPI003EB98982